VPRFCRKASPTCATPRAERIRSAH
jgi:hypothetical protein